MSEIREIVFGYVTNNNHEKGLSTFHFKGVKGSPGPDWLIGFMKRQNLSLKQARHDATRIPFIIYHYFDILEETVKKLGTVLKTDLILFGIQMSQVSHTNQKNVESCR